MPGDPEFDPGWWRLPLAILAVACAASLAIWAWDLDRTLAALCYGWNAAHGGNLHTAWWCIGAYYIPGAIAGGIGLAALVVIMRKLGRQPAAGCTRLRNAFCLLLILALGPGLLVNAVLKDHWGRARPRETVCAGGSAGFQQPWEPGIAGRGKSFPCGHAAVPALGIAAWLVWRRRRPVLARWCLGGGLALTTYVGFARMLAGAHWLSDVVWALAVVAIVATLVHRVMLAPPGWWRPPQAMPVWGRRLILVACPALGIALVAAVLLATPFAKDVGLRAELQREAWKLSMVAERIDVEVALERDLPQAVVVEGLIQGFAWPGARIEDRIESRPGEIRVAVGTVGCFSERVGRLRVHVSTERLAGIELTAGDIAVRGEGMREPERMALRSSSGRVLLPSGWQAQPALMVGR